MGIYINQHQKGLSTLGLRVATFRKKSHSLYNDRPKRFKQPKMNSYPSLISGTYGTYYIISGTYGTHYI